MTETSTQGHKHTKAKTQTHKDKDITTNAWASAAGQTRKDGPHLGSLLEALFKIMIAFPQEIYVCLLLTHLSWKSDKLFV